MPIGLLCRGDGMHGNARTTGLRRKAPVDNGGMDMTTKSFWIATIMCSTIFLSTFVGIGGAQGTGDGTLDSSLVLETEKTTDRFGGGSYVAIKSPDRDAWAAVIYGTQANPNVIVIAAMYTRYLGGATVYDQSGGLISKSVPLPVYTYFAQSLEDIYEFNDVNGNGIGDVVRSNNPIRVGEIVAHEPVYKSVSLNTVWTRSEITKTTNGTAKEWTFSLTANNLQYTVLGDPAKVSTDVGDFVLNSVTFTFHLTAELKRADASVPWYKVTVEKGAGKRWQVAGSEQDGTRDFQGEKVSASFKYDHELVGWDFEPRNDAPGLVLETHAMWGFAVKKKVAQWYNEQFVEGNARGDGQLSYDTDNGTQTMAPSDLQDSGVKPADIERPKLVKKNELRFDDNWQRVGRLTWVSDVDTYADANAPAESKNMYFQIHGGRKLAGYTMGGAVYRTVVVLGGFSYPGAYRIFHDPEFSADMVQLDIPTVLGTGQAQRVVTGLVVVVLGGVIAVVAAAVYLGRRKRSE
jgi:hypothetical protein